MPPTLLPIRATEDRIFRTTVCTRPFRAQGPRIEAERVGEKLVVHNYGHGGSGWSLSWGSGTIALALALAGRDPSRTDIAVIGCGALGLTSAILAQRAGCRVTIYAKDRPADSRSFRATGSWTPDSRVALTKSAPAAFAAQWEQMTRTSWGVYQKMLGSPSALVESSDRFYLSDLPPDEAERKKIADDSIGFAIYRPRIADLLPAVEDMPPGTHPFPRQWARRRSEMVFHISEYVEHLTDEFLRHGGNIVTREFHTPAEFASLSEPVILHCTGYAAQCLFSDHSLTPVRGQIAWLIPQPEVNYGLYVDNLGILSRRDGIVVQISEQGEASGYNVDNETPDRREAEEGVRQLAALYSRMKPA